MAWLRWTRLRPGRRLPSEAPFDIDRAVQTLKMRNLQRLCARRPVSVRPSHLQLVYSRD
jgi:hypothetical protein